MDEFSEVTVSLFKDYSGEDVESLKFDLEESKCLCEEQESAECFVPSPKHAKVECGDFENEEAVEDATEVQLQDWFTLESESTNSSVNGLDEDLETMWEDVLLTLKEEKEPENLRDDE